MGIAKLIGHRGRGEREEGIVACQVVSRSPSPLVESIKQAGQIKKGILEPSRTFEFDPLDIKAIRQKIHQSQREFALMIGVSVSTLQNWEQGRRKPTGPARALLRVTNNDGRGEREEDIVVCQVLSRSPSPLHVPVFGVQGLPCLEGLIYLLNSIYTH